MTGFMNTLMKKIQGLEVAVEKGGGELVEDLTKQSKTQMRQIGDLLTKVSALEKHAPNMIAAVPSDSGNEAKDVAADFASRMAARKASKTVTVRSTVPSHLRPKVTLSNMDETQVCDISAASTPGTSPSKTHVRTKHAQPATPDVDGPFQMEGEFHTLLNTSTYERLLEEKMTMEEAEANLSMLSSSMNNSMANISMISSQFESL